MVTTAFNMPIFLTFFVLLLSSGCSTIDKRIKENAHQFGTFAPETQAQIQNGRIDKGFTEDMVYMAKGAPKDKSKMTVEGKELVLWKYPTKDLPRAHYAGNTGLSGGYGYPGFGPGPSQPAALSYERELAVVQFKDGRVLWWDPRLQED